MYGLILAGGNGTRFWPRSRESCPKQLLKITPEQEATMVEVTLNRIKQIIPPEKIIIVTSQRQYEQIEALVGSQVKAIIPEPVSRNTAAAITLSAVIFQALQEDEVMGVFPADHIVENEKLFLRKLEEAEHVAKLGYLVTLGIIPSRVEQGYGYIRIGSRKIDKLDCYPVESFTEKPDILAAKRYVSDGSYYWNSGVFVWQASTLLEQMGLYQPEMVKNIRNYAENADFSGKQDSFGDFYQHLEDISIDYALMEKSDKIAMLPVDIGWQDISTWSALERVVKKDASGNIIEGNAIAIRTKDSIVLGVSDLIVIDSDDAILICPKSEAENVKEVVTELERRGDLGYI